MPPAPLPKRSASARRRADARSRSPEPLRVLTVGTDDWAIEQAAAAIELAGHTVLRCHEPGEQPFPCNALRAGRRCPLDEGAGVVVTSRARPTDQPAAAEIGVVCGLHAGLPLIVSGISRNSPYAGLADLVVAEQGDLVEAVENVATDASVLSVAATGADPVDPMPVVVSIPEVVEQ